MYIPYCLRGQQCHNGHIYRNITTLIINLNAQYLNTLNSDSKYNAFYFEYIRLHIFSYAATFNIL